MVDDPHHHGAICKASSSPELIVSLRNTIGAKTESADFASSTTMMSDFEIMSKRVRHHRSISQLIENFGKFLFCVCASAGLDY